MLMDTVFPLPFCPNFLIIKDEEVNKFLPWYPMKNLDDTRQFYEERYASKYAQPQGYAYAICLKEDNFPTGYIKVGMEEHHDFGYDRERKKVKFIFARKNL